MYYFLYIWTFFLLSFEVVKNKKTWRFKFYNLIGWLWFHYCHHVCFFGADAFYWVHQSQEWECGVSKQMFQILRCTVTVPYCYRWYTRNIAIFFDWFGFDIPSEKISSSVLPSKTHKFNLNCWICANDKYDENNSYDNNLYSY